MAENAHFPMSDSRREELRSRGEVAFSYDLQTTALFIGIAIGGYFASDFLVDSLGTFFREALAHSPKEAFNQAGLILIEATLLFAFFAIFFSFIIGLYQTKFLITFETMKTGVPLFPNRRFRENGVGGALVNLFKAFLAVVAVALVIQSSLTGDLLPWFQHFLDWESPQSTQFEIAQFAPVFWRLLLTIVLLAIVFGVLSRIFASILFEQRHKMTLAELQAEAREAEGSSIVRDQLG